MKYEISNRMSGLQPSAIREILKATQDPKIISFAAGNPSSDAFPVQKIKKITDDIFEQDPIGALQYSVTEGYTPLRETMKDLMHSYYGVPKRDFDELIIVSGAQQGIELTTKCLVNEGDTVICEAPSFIGALNTFRSYGAKLVGVELEDDGMNIEKLEEALKTNKNARFIYVIPNFQNPSGITTSLEKRKAIYELAKKYSVMIMEDNPYGDLRYSGEYVPSIKSMDTDGLVIYLGSFSKILSPGMRVGYVMAPRELLQKVIVAKQCSDVHTTILQQMICDRFLKENDLSEHVAMLRDMYRKKSALMIGEMEKQFNPKVTFTRPQGGLFLWCTLPEGADMMDFCRKAVSQNVAVVPGNAFTMYDTDVTYSFRMNFSTPSDEQIVKGIEILGKMTRELF